MRRKYILKKYTLENLKRLKKIRLQIKNIKTKKKGTRLMLYRRVSTKTLFKTNLDYSRLTKDEKTKYIDKLTDEFLENADDLMKSLEDK
jgi:hypothetical protein